MGVLLLLAGRVVAFCHELLSTARDASVLVGLLLNLLVLESLIVQRLVHAMSRLNRRIRREGKIVFAARRTLMADLRRRRRVHTDEVVMGRDTGRTVAVNRHPVLHCQLPLLALIQIVLRLTRHQSLPLIGRLQRR